MYYSYVLRTKNNKKVVVINNNIINSYDLFHIFTSLNYQQIVRLCKQQKRKHLQVIMFLNHLNTIWKYYYIKNKTSSIKISQYVWHAQLYCFQNFYSPKIALHTTHQK